MQSFFFFPPLFISHSIPSFQSSHNGVRIPTKQMIINPHPPHPAAYAGDLEIDTLSEKHNIM